MPRCDTEAMNPALRRDRHPNHAGRTRRNPRRSGRMASLRRIGRPLQHHAHSVARHVPGAEPPRKHLAVHARQLALEPGPSTTLSITAARPGTSSSISPGGSCPSERANGPTGSNQRVLVLELRLGPPSEYGAMKSSREQRRERIRCLAACHSWRAPRGSAAGASGEAVPSCPTGASSRHCDSKIRDSSAESISKPLSSFLCAGSLPARMARQMSPLDTRLH
jgi:hypothetical protein